MTKIEQARFWCFTAYKKPLSIENEKLRYIIFGEEVCPNTGRLHWQGYLECKNKQSMTAMKKILDDKTIHLEQKSEFSTREQAREYCKKNNKFEEYGEFISGQGSRKDLHEIAKSLQNGTPLHEIMMNNPEIYCSYRNGLRDIAEHCLKVNSKEQREVEVILITGPTGVGKTYYAMNHCSEMPYKIQGEDLKWWDGYNGEKTIVIDEYNNDVGIGKMLGFLDVYQLRLDIKGSHTFANWNTVVVTTNLELYELHPNAKKRHREALFRRISKIFYMENRDSMIEIERSDAEKMFNDIAQLVKTNDTQWTLRKR